MRQEWISQKPLALNIAMRYTSAVHRTTIDKAISRYAKMCGDTSCDTETRECTYSSALGSLLLLFIAETARRNATEGFLWSIFQQDRFLKSTTHVLFVAGQPTRIHKDALEAAARWLNLRHVFGIEGLQSWFDTVYLQFGFTHRGFRRRLPEWLVGQGRTQAIQHLLEGSMKSETFRALWDALRNFRRKNIKEVQMRSRLDSSP